MDSFFTAFTADLRNIGKADLLSYWQVALGNGDGTFNVLNPLCTADGCAVDAVADFNGDGKPDVLVVNGSYQYKRSAILLGNGDGTFGAPNFLYGNLPTAMVADMNGDGRPDIVFPWGAQFGLPGVGVLFNTTSSGFELSAKPLSPSTVVAGNAATSTVAVAPTFGFSGTVTLSCSGLPSGASCGFNPATISKASGTSALTVTTSTTTPAGTYPVKVSGTSGSIVQSTTLSQVVQAAPDFAVGPALGQSTSQTISAGQSAKFDMQVTPAGTFSGTVSLSCNITPVVTPAPTCTVPSSVSVAKGTPAPFTATVGTTAAVTTGTVSYPNLPLGGMRFAWLLLLPAAGLLGVAYRRRPALAAAMVILGVASWVACGGGGGSSSHAAPGTPAGTYTATITAKSGSLNHNTVLTVVVQ